MITVEIVKYIEVKADLSIIRLLVFASVDLTQLLIRRSCDFHSVSRRLIRFEL